MAELTTLESKQAEVTGLAMTARGSGLKMQKLAKQEDARDLVKTLDRMAKEAVLTMAEAGEVGHWEIVDVLARKAGNKQVQELAAWAIPIQQCHLGNARQGSLKLAEQENPKRRRSP